MPYVWETTDAANNTSTTYTLQVGDIAQGTLNSNDTILSTAPGDWYAVDLVAGQEYTVALVGTTTWSGTTSNSVADPYLELIGLDGTTIIMNNDNGLPNDDSIITFTAAASGTYYLNATGYDTGYYRLSVTTGPQALVDLSMGPNIIDAYGNGNEYSWSPAAHTGATVTVGFRLTDDLAEPNFSQFTTEQITATTAVLSYFEDVSGLNFNVVSDAGSSYTDNATILLSNYNNDDNSGGYAYYPQHTGTDVDGDIHINAFENSTTSVNPGSYEFYTLLHEMGHAVGLSHPGSYNAGPDENITYADHAQFTNDSYQYTVMSYFDESNTLPGGVDYGSYPDTLMVYDIYALHLIYGANYDTRSGNTTYGYNTTGEMVGSIYDFNSNADPVMSIWDGGGIDTIDLSGSNHTNFVSLIAGASFSSVLGYTDNLTIAYGATIENFVGGSGDDLLGLSSDDTDNHIDGNGGTDTVYVTYSYGSGYSIQAGSTASNFVMIGANGTDTILNFEYVQFFNGTTVSTAALIDIRNDFNGDGTSDILWYNASTTGVGMYEMNNGIPSWSSIGTGAANWEIVGTGDFTGDHHDDILWYNSATGSIGMYQMFDGTPTWSSIGTAGSGWTVNGTGDFNGDGTDDILWFNASTGSVGMYEMSNGSASWGWIGTAGSGWEVVGTGDFNGDLTDDILWFNASSGSIGMYQMNNGTPSWGWLGTAGSGWEAVETGDFNGDSTDDILWFNASAGSVGMYQMNNGTPSWSWLGTAGSDWAPVAAGDYNGDNTDDILWHNASTGAVGMYEMNNGSPSWQFIGTSGSGWEVLA
jgi:serralysin